MEDVAQWLGGKLPKDIQKVGVIESTDMSKMQDENGKKINQLPYHVKINMLLNQSNLLRKS